MKYTSWSTLHEICPSSFFCTFFAPV